MIGSSSSMPTITGIYGSNQNTDMKVKLTSHSTNTSFGLYSVE